MLQGMLQAFVITLREGLEAFLIVAISIAYLKKSQRSELIPAVRWGIGVSILLSIGAAIVFYRLAGKGQSLWEGVLGLVAAVSVASLTVHMWRAGKRIKSDIEGHLKSSAVKSETAAYMGVFFFTLLMMTREGMETALLMGTVFFQAAKVDAPTATIIVGGLAGTAVAAFVASLWSRYGHRVNLGLFFQVTAVFLFIFVIQLFIFGIHELTEANVLPFSTPVHEATEAYGPDGTYGHYLTYLLVLMPVAWLAFSSLFGSRKRMSPATTT